MRRARGQHTFHEDAKVAHLVVEQLEHLALLHRKREKVGAQPNASDTQRVAKLEAAVATQQ
tara:strand:+ start:370 stop:552 length:183 start_codon:yes stop_codon:yes gene_type:complete